MQTAQSTHRYESILVKNANQLSGEVNHAVENLLESHLVPGVLLCAPLPSVVSLSESVPVSFDTDVHSLFDEAEDAFVIITLLCHEFV